VFEKERERRIEEKGRGKRMKKKGCKSSEEKR
jgi:hypothetical protein